MAIESYYARLGVGEDATSDQIKRAFRALALKYHPDRNQGDAMAEARFKEISAANEVLADPAARRAYDLSRIGGSSIGADYYHGPASFGAGCGRGRGCCGRRGKFGRGAAAGTCVLELTPEEARQGVEKDFVMEVAAGFVSFTVAIPPGTAHGSVFRVGIPVEDSLAGEFDLHVKIV